MEKETKGWRNCIFFRRSEKLVHLIWDSQLFALCCYSLSFWGLLLLKVPSTEIWMFLEDHGFRSFFMYKKGWSWCLVQDVCVNLWCKLSYPAFDELYGLGIKRKVIKIWTKHEILILKFRVTDIRSNRGHKVKIFIKNSWSAKKCIISGFQIHLLTFVNMHTPICQC